ncbi:hypothetical protein [Clostridium phage Amboise]|nr:hypothetical protein [Clostridium phage Amboise]
MECIYLRQHDLRKISRHQAKPYTRLSGTLRREVFSLKS